MSFFRRWDKVSSAVLMTFALVVAVSVMIFRFSAQPAEESVQTSQEIVDVALDVFVPKLEEYPEEEQKQIEDRMTHTVRKAAHVLEYAALGGALLLHFCAIRAKMRQQGKTFRFVAVAAFAISVVYAITDEIHQGFVGGRGPGTGDVLLDACGVLLGFALATLGMWFLQRIFRKKRKCRKSFQEKLKRI